MWTEFWDMHSGGSLKTPYDKIYIEAKSEEEALVIFQNRFNENPYSVGCSCCGSNFAIQTNKTLAEATWYARGCTEKVKDKWIGGMSIQKLKQIKEICILFKKDILPEERIGEVPEYDYDFYDDYEPDDWDDWD